MRYASLALLGGALAAPATAGTVTVTIPRLNVAEYHRPYIAVWLEPAAGGPAQTIAVWYAVTKTGAEPGTKWLADLRTWWRKGGRSLKVPANGVSGATRAPGTHSITIPDNIRPGQYTMFVESAREAGGREVVSLPLSVPLKAATAAGKTELGAISLSVR